MEREIKFRGISKKSGEWVYGCYMRLSGIDFIMPENTPISEFNKKQFISGRDFIEVISESLGQFTGLKDKDLNEIYEGDILIYTRKHWYCPGHPKHNTDLVDQVEVYWDEEKNRMSTRTFDFERLKRNPNQRPYSSSGSLGAGWNDERADANIVEIIGNIRQNPELLEAKE